MKTFCHVIALLALLGLSGSFKPVERPCNCLLAESMQNKPLFTCENRSSPGQPIKCRVERGKIVYLFINKKVRPDRYEFEVTATKGKDANKVFFTDLVIKDERSTNGTYHVFFYYATNSGYRWAVSKTDYLKVTYDSRSGELNFEAVGKMQNFEDTKNGYAPGEVERIMKQRFKERGFSEENMIRAASAYFILNYTKAFQS
ncbi:MAG: hypothetical protein RMJ44_07890 [Cytophagales bacterium]|nr:hypothetical protein [Bernardetiaceae bacterium]MDW8210996.1 hypothetical protein [Cytophagales bacterium]